MVEDHEKHFHRSLTAISALFFRKEYFQNFRRVLVSLNSAVPNIPYIIFVEDYVRTIESFVEIDSLVSDNKLFK